MTGKLEIDSGLERISGVTLKLYNCSREIDQVGAVKVHVQVRLGFWYVMFIIQS